MKLFITIVLLVMWSSSKSQLQIGGRLGTSLANLESADDESYKWRQGVYGGLIFNYQINPELLLQTETNYSSEGGKKQEIQMVPAGACDLPAAVSGQPIYANLQTTTKLDYLEVPVLAKFMLGNKVKYFMCFGPYVSLLLNAQREASGNSIVYLDKGGTKTLKDAIPPETVVSTYFDYTANINNEVKKANYGFIGGCGLQFATGPGAIFMEYRLKLGLTDINRYPSVDDRHQATSISLSAGYVMHIN